MNNLDKLGALLDKSDVKIQVTPKTSAIIQEFVFTKGYRWGEQYNPFVKHLSHPYLYLYMYDKAIRYSDAAAPEDFIKHENTLFIFNSDWDQDIERKVLEEFENASRIIPLSSFN